MKKDDLHSKVIELANHRIGAISGISKNAQSNHADVRFWLSGVQIIGETGVIEGVCLFQIPADAIQLKETITNQFLIARVNKTVKIEQYPVF